MGARPALTVPPISAKARQDLLDHYRTMVRIRRFEEAVARYFREGAVHGFVHVSLGQEAVASGACSALAPGDMITTTHRGHGHCIAKGADPERMMAELFGRSTGICGGKGGSMHIADPSLGILGANGIVGAGIPLAVGAALAARVRKTGAVAVAFFGEGAVHSGAFHEAVTLAVAWSLPVVFVCEDNGYAEFTQSGTWQGPRVVERASGYGMPAMEVEGSDPRAVHEAVSSFAGRARAGEGPLFVVAHTFRFSGHYEGDAEAYRTDEERAQWEQRDPLALARAALGAAAGDTVAEIERQAAEEIDAAVSRAADAPYPSADAVLDHVHG
jgi:TPP-dependent pyruvate/acetoin dehydrogenase alpha subunit